ncbi:heme peroxidase family protein [Archangium violaceum]|uniref:peroxidase family protein n=1 Tax=Archangium violaceum TaxID=83451 RepID=UPI002B2A7060|nr:heme peroxidase family protein [Archangium gephyra]
MLHGETQVRGHNPPESQFHDRGRFGRLFPGLPVFAPDNDKVRQALFELGRRGGLMDALDIPPPATVPPPPAGHLPGNPDNTPILAGFTFFGQFTDHDLTFDPTSILERQNDPEAIENFRTPAFELDNVYGSGPRVSRHLYDINDPAKFLIEKLGGPDSNDDMPRNSQNTALIADPRNDENTIVSQFHVAILKFHNAVVDHLRKKSPNDPQVFEKAQRMVRWHYQWIILHDFLPKIVGQQVVDDVLDDRPRERIFRWRNEPFIPVEFSVAAYRFGHSQVRPAYGVNNAGFGAPIFDDALDPAAADPNDLRGGKRATRRFVDWSRFFEGLGGDPARRNISKLIDSRLSTRLFTLLSGAPGQVGGANLATITNPQSLAQRNLLRSLALRLPSGQAMAKRLGIKPRRFDELKDLGVGFETSTPPWYYILKESEVEEGNKGARLGAVGARIVAEVFVGVLRGDRFSFLNANPNWKPELANAEGKFLMADLLKFAGFPVVPVPAPAPAPAPTPTPTPAPTP